MSTTERLAPRRENRPPLVTAVLFVALVCVCATPAFAFGNREHTVLTGNGVLEAETGDRVEVYGRVRRVGSDPFPVIVVTDEYEIDWYIPEDAELLAAFEQQRVTVQGTLFIRPLTLANGQSVGTRRELTDVQTIEQRGSR